MVLSLASCQACLLLDDELNILPTSTLVKVRRRVLRSELMACAAAIVYTIVPPPNATLFSSRPAAHPSASDMPRTCTWQHRHKLS